jgi:hypothetical protein
MDLNQDQFSLFPPPKFTGNARGFVGPQPAPKQLDAQNPHGAYIRFGDWPHNERSMNHVTGGTEDGVSVYDMHGPLAEPVDPDPHGSRYEEALADEWGRDFAEEFGNDTGQEMKERRGHAFQEAKNYQTWEPHENIPQSRRGHFVTGSLVAFGHDNEPLLNNVRKVGDWPQHAHRFVPGEDAPMFSLPSTRKYVRPLPGPLGNWQKDI